MYIYVYLFIFSDKISKETIKGKQIKQIPEYQLPFFQIDLNSKIQIKEINDGHWSYDSYKNNYNKINSKGLFYCF